METRYGRNEGLYKGTLAKKNNEKPLSYFNMNDLNIFKKFLEKTKILKEEEIKNLSLNKLKIFLKNMGSSSIQVSPYSNHVEYYNIQYALTNGQAYLYGDINKINLLDKKAILNLKNICNSKIYSKRTINHNDNCVVIIHFFKNEQEYTKYAKIHNTKYVIGDYNVDTKIFKPSPYSVSLNNAEIIEILK